MKGKTVFVTGGSRGIGKAIALRCAQAGANIIIAAKTTEPHPKLEGTIYTAAEEMVAAGGQALPLKVDIREESMIQEAVQKAVDTFGGIDILINNASAIDLRPSSILPEKRYDLMHDINVRGTFLTTKYCMPHLKNGDNSHVLTLSPPINMDKKWFGNHLAYTMSKYGMSMTVIGFAEEMKSSKVAVNALWPRTTIATAAVRNLLGGEQMIRSSRTPQIMADAAWEIFNRDSGSCTGNFFIDEEVLKEAGVTDFSNYAVDSSRGLMTDLFLND